MVTLKQIMKEAEKQKVGLFLKGNGKDKLPTFIISNGNKGYRIEKQGDKVHNGDLNAHLVNEFLDSLIKIETKKGKQETTLKCLGAKVEFAQFKMELIYRPGAYYLTYSNGCLQRTNKFELPIPVGNHAEGANQKALWDAHDNIILILNNVFKSTAHDFLRVKDLIGLIDTFLLEQ